jgi:spore maturation protein CgeB
MRWLLAHPGPDFSVQDVYTGWAEALRGLGQQVGELNLNDRLRFYNAALIETGETDDQGHPQVRAAFSRDEASNMAAEGILALAYTWWPDVVLVISGFFMPTGLLDILRSRGHKVVLLHTESPYQDDAQLARAGHADINLVNDPATLPTYRKLGPAEYMPHAYRPAFHKPGPAVPALKSDFCFCGTGWPSRRSFLEQMNLDGLDVILAGPWFGVEDSPLRRYLAHDSGHAAGNDQAVSIYRSSKAGINFYRREGEDGMKPGVAMGPREVEMAATGLFFLRDRRPESDETFPMLPAFDTPADASEQLRWWLARDRQREDAARRARAAVEGRTFENNARRLLRLLDR